MWPNINIVTTPSTNIIFSLERRDCSLPLLSLLSLSAVSLWKFQIEPLSSSRLCVSQQTPGRHLAPFVLLALSVLQPHKCGTALLQSRRGEEFLVLIKLNPSRCDHDLSLILSEENFIKTRDRSFASITVYFPKISMSTQTDADTLPDTQHTPDSQQNRLNVHTNKYRHLFWHSLGLELARTDKNVDKEAANWYILTPQSSLGDKILLAEWVWELSLENEKKWEYLTPYAKSRQFV